MSSSGVLTEKKKKFDWNHFQRKAAPYFFISPFYIAFLVFNAFPILFSLFLSFQRWNGGRPWQFAGFSNFIYIFRDMNFWNSLWFTFTILIFTIVPLHCLSIFFAFLLNSAFVKFKSFFKSLFFLPYITSSVAIAVVFWLLYAPQGILNYIIAHYLTFLVDIFKLKMPLPWLNQLFLVSLSIIMVWRLIGWNTILYFAGLQGIPKSLYEAARVDGASWPQIFFRVTLPLLRPMIYFAVTMSVITLMQLFDEPAVLVGTNNLPYVPALTVVIYLYNQAFSQMNFGIAAATSYFLFIVIFLLSRILRFIFKEK